MPTKKKPSAAAAVIPDLIAKVEKIVELAGNVLAKFPAETVPPALRPFLASGRLIVLLGKDRGSSESDDLDVVLFRGLLRNPDRVRIPLAWLDMHESQITSAVRKLYWASTERTLRAEIKGLEADIERQAGTERASQQRIVELTRIAAAAQKDQAEKRVALLEVQERLAQMLGAQNGAADDAQTTKKDDQP